MNQQKWKELLIAARHGKPDAQWEVCLYYEDGLNDPNGKTLVRKNPAKAVAWYRRAAENGDVSGQNALAVCLSSGICVAKDDKEAIYWTTKAIQAGDAGAASNLAMIYRDQGNYKKAFYWFKRAITMGDADALY